MTSQWNVPDTSVTVEHSNEYAIIFCIVTDTSWAVKNSYDMNVCTKHRCVFPVSQPETFHSSMFAEHLPRSNRGCDHRRCLMRFRDNENDVCGKPYFGRSCIADNRRDKDILDIA